MSELKKEWLSKLTSIIKSEQKDRIDSIHKSMISKIKDGDPIPSIEFVTFLVESWDNEITKRYIKQEDNLLLYGTIDKQ